MNFFLTQNASRPYKSGRYEFNFEPYVFFAGIWRGALTSDSDPEIAALRELVNNGIGIEEIDQATYEVKTKKKVSAPPSAPVSLHSAWQRKASIKSPAEVVEDPQMSNPAIIPIGTAKSIDDILMEATVMPSQPQPLPFAPPVPTETSPTVARPKNKGGRPRKNPLP